MNEHDFTPKRKKPVWSFIICVVFAVMFIIMGLTGDEHDAERAYFSIVGAVFFGGLALFGAYYMFIDKKPIFRLTDDGICARSVGVIPWNCVKDVTLSDFRYRGIHTYTVTVALHNADFLGRNGIFGAVANRVRKKLIVQFNVDSNDDYCTILAWARLHGVQI